MTRQIDQLSSAELDQLSLVELFTLLRESGIEIGAEGDLLHVAGPSAALTPTLRALLTSRKGELVAHLGQRKQHTIKPGMATADGVEIPLSFAQRRLWFIELLEPEGTGYTIGSAVQMRGPIDVEILEASLREIIRRHSILRSVIRDVSGEPYQTTMSEDAWCLNRVDLRELSPALKEQEIQQQSTRMARQPFDLAHDYMLRAVLLQFTDEESRLLVKLHHIAADGWSMSILWREVGAIYEAFATGKPSRLPELPIQYGDFAVWQRRTFQGEALDRLTTYWRRQLAGHSPLELPTDHPRPQRMSYRGGRVAFTLPDRLVRAVQRLAKEENATPSMVYLSVFQILLARYARVDDVAVGMPIANRNHAEIEDLIGFFVNTLVVRTDLADNPTFRQLLGRVREVALDAYDHQDLPFDVLVEELNPVRDLSRNPLVQVSLAIQTTPDEKLILPGIDIQHLPYDSGAVRFDLELHLWPWMNCDNAELLYCSDLFERATIERMAGHFVKLLEAIATDPDQRISEIPMLVRAEREQALITWNATEVNFSAPAPVHELFERQASCAPEALAISNGREELTYGALNRIAIRLAVRLRSLGVGPETVVGICAPRSMDLVAASVGILKAGGAFMPLDPTHPPERMSFMVSDSGAKVVVAARGEASRFGFLPAPIIDLEEVWCGGDEAGGLAPDSGLSEENLAYIIYTSGSTGRPKAVAIEHKGLNNLVAWHCAEYHLHATDRATMIASPTFDASVWEIWPCLASGASLHIPDDSVRRDPDAILRWLAAKRISVAFLPTPLAELVLSRPWHDDVTLRYLFTGGDALHRRPSDDVSASLVNLYGPTETSVVSTSSVVDRGHEGDTTPSIGRPIANDQVYILDETMQPVPLGIPGEIYIGGAGLARGYVGNAGLTAEKFVPNPYGLPGSRLYRTGDLARHRPDASIEYLGRLDQQVKVRGFRVELGEIESTLAAHPDVLRCAVVLQEYTPDDPRLVAFVVPSDPASFNSDVLRGYLKQRLPAYMAPASIVQIDRLPLTSSGKVDRRVLSSAELTQPFRPTTSAQHSTATEAKLLEIWSKLVHNEQIGVHDNFFDLGGHSLMASRLLAMIEDTLGRRIPLAAIFEAPTIAELAHYIDADANVAQAAMAKLPLVPIHAEGTRPPLFLIHGLGGAVVGYADLARTLGPEQPVYGLQAAGLEGECDPDENVETMAARYVDAIVRHQPQGPYRFAGYCFGGVVAFEMARQMTAARLPISLVGIIESSVVRKTEGRHRASFASRAKATRQQIPFWLRDYPSLGPGGRRRLLSWKVRQWLRVRRTGQERVAELRAGDILPVDLSGMPERHQHMMEVQADALGRYHPEPYPGLLTVFKARDLSITDVVLGSLDPALGWGSLADQVEVVQVAGSHRNVHLTPHVTSLGGELVRLLR